MPSNTYEPLKRDRSTELSALADRIAELVNAGHDRVLCDDVYQRLAASWERVPPEKVSTLRQLQTEAVNDLLAGEHDADRIMSAYEFLWKRIRFDNDPWPADPPMPRRTGPTAGQKAAAFAGGVVAGHFAYRVAKSMLGSLAAPLKALGGLLR